MKESRGNFYNLKHFRNYNEDRVAIILNIMCPKNKIEFLTTQKHLKKLTKIKTRAKIKFKHIQYKINRHLEYHKIKFIRHHKSKNLIMILHNQIKTIRKAYTIFYLIF